MKKIFFLATMLFFLSCKEEQKQREKAQIPPEQYKSIMRDLILAQKVKEIMVRKDSVDMDPVAVVYEQYGIDSVKLKKATDYYSQDPSFFVELYTSIQNELKKKLDSLEKNNKGLSKIGKKGSEVKLKKGVADKILKKNPKQINQK